MKNFFLGKLLGYVAKKLDGYKTKIGGVGLIFIGIAGIFGEMYPDQGLPDMGIEASLVSIASGFTALGIGSKAEKLTSAIKKDEQG